MKTTKAWVDQRWRLLKKTPMLFPFKSGMETPESAIQTFPP
jgi:hypothetical protein